MFNLRVKQIELFASTLHEWLSVYTSIHLSCFNLLGSDKRSVTRGEKLVWPDLQLQFYSRRKTQ